MDELNLYDDLDEFQEQQEKKSKELQDVEEKYQQSLKTIEELREENKTLKKNIQRIELGFQSLLDTARTEIKRKDKEIERLRKEKDDICFRRKIPQKASNNSGNQQLVHDATVNNPFKSDSVNNNNESSTIDTATIRTADPSNYDLNTEVKKRHRGRDEERDHQPSDYKRHRGARDEFNDKFEQSSHKHTKIKHNSDDVQKGNRDLYRETDKDSHYRRDHNRNRSRERKEYDKTSSRHGKSSKASRSPDRYGRHSERSRSGERDKYQHFERNRSHDHKNSGKYSKLSSRSPTRKNTETNRDDYQRDKSYKETDKSHKQIDKDLGKQKSKDFKEKEENKKTILVKETELKRTDNLLNEKANMQLPTDNKTKGINSRNLKNLDKKETTEITSSDNLKIVTINEELSENQTNNSEKELNKQSENIKQLETIQALNQSSVPEPSKICTPRKIALFNQLFGQTPSESSTTATSGNSTNSLLNNIKGILAKSSPVDVISSATTSPGEYTDISSGKATPKENAIEIVSSGSNTPHVNDDVNDELPTPKRIDIDIDECSIPTSNIPQNIKTIACVDLTEIVDDNIENELEFIQIPGLDLCFQSKNKANSSEIQENEDIISKDQSKATTKNNNSEINDEVKTSQEKLTEELNEGHELETDNKPEATSCANFDIDSELENEADNIIEQESCNINETLELSPSEQDISKETTAANAESLKPVQLENKLSEIANNLTSEVVIVDSVKSGNGLSFQNPYNKENDNQSSKNKCSLEEDENINEMKTNLIAKEKQLYLLEDGNENRATKDAEDETHTSSKDELQAQTKQRTINATISIEESKVGAVAQACSSSAKTSCQEDDQNFINFKSGDKNTLVIDNILASNSNSKENLVDIIVECDKQLESASEAKLSSPVPLKVITIEEQHEALSPCDPASASKSIYSNIKIVEENLATTSNIKENLNEIVDNSKQSNPTVTDVLSSLEALKVVQIQQNEASSLSQKLAAATFGNERIETAASVNKITDSDLLEDPINNTSSFSETKTHLEPTTIVEDNLNEIEIVENDNESEPKQRVLEAVQREEKNGSLLIEKDGQILSPLTDNQATSCLTEKLDTTDYALEANAEYLTGAERTESDLSEITENKEDYSTIQDDFKVVQNKEQYPSSIEAESEYLTAADSTESDFSENTVNNEDYSTIQDNFKVAKNKEADTENSRPTELAFNDSTAIEIIESHLSEKLLNIEENSFESNANGQETSLKTTKDIVAQDTRNEQPTLEINNSTAYEVDSSDLKHKAICNEIQEISTKIAIKDSNRDIYTQEPSISTLNEDNNNEISKKITGSHSRGETSPTALAKDSKIIPILQSSETLTNNTDLEAKEKTSSILENDTEITNETPTLKACDSLEVNENKDETKAENKGMDVEEKLSSHGNYATESYVEETNEEAIEGIAGLDAKKNINSRKKDESTTKSHTVETSTEDPANENFTIQSNVSEALDTNEEANIPSSGSKEKSGSNKMEETIGDSFVLKTPLRTLTNDTTNKTLSVNTSDSEAEKINSTKNEITKMSAQDSESLSLKACDTTAQAENKDEHTAEIFDLVSKENTNSKKGDATKPVSHIVETLTKESKSEDKNHESYKSMLDMTTKDENVADKNVNLELTVKSPTKEANDEAISHKNNVTDTASHETETRTTIPKAAFENCNFDTDRNVAIAVNITDEPDQMEFKETSLGNNTQVSQIIAEERTTEMITQISKSQCSEATLQKLNQKSITDIEMVAEASNSITIRPTDVSIEVKTNLTEQNKSETDSGVNKATQNSPKKKQTNFSEILKKQLKEYFENKDKNYTESNANIKTSSKMIPIAFENKNEQKLDNKFTKAIEKCVLETDWGQTKKDFEKQNNKFKSFTTKLSDHNISKVATEKTANDFENKEDKKTLKDFEINESKQTETVSNQTHKINNDLEPHRVESLNKGQEQVATEKTANDFENKEEKKTLKDFEINESKQTEKVSNQTRKINDDLEPHRVELLNKGQEEKNLHDLQNNLFKKPYTSAVVASPKKNTTTSLKNKNERTLKDFEINESQQTKTVSNQTQNINENLESQRVESLNKGQQEKMLHNLQKDLFKKPRITLTASPKKNTAKTSLKNKEKLAKSDEITGQLANNFKEAIPNQNIEIKDKNTNDFEADQTDIVIDQTPEINEAIEIPTNKEDNQKEVPEKEILNIKTSLDLVSNKKPTTTSFKTKKETSFKSIELKAQYSKQHKEQHAAVETPSVLEQQYTNTEYIGTLESVNKDCESNLIENMPVNLHSKKALPVDTKMSTVLNTISNRVQKTLGDIETAITSYESEADNDNIADSDHPIPSTSAQSLFESMAHQVGEVTRDETHIQKQSSIEEAVHKEAKIIEDVVKNSKDILDMEKSRNVPEEILKSGSKFLNNNSICSVEQTLTCEPQVEHTQIICDDRNQINKDSKTIPLSAVVNIEHSPLKTKDLLTNVSKHPVETLKMYSPNKSFKKLITKEINMEGEIVEVVTIQMPTDSNAANSNITQNILDNIKKNLQTTEILTGVECSSSKDQQAVKLATKSNNLNSQSNENSTAQNKSEISTNEYNVEKNIIEKSPLKECQNTGKETEITLSEEAQYQTPKKLPTTPGNLNKIYKIVQVNFHKMASNQPETFSTPPALPSISTTSPTPSNFSGIFSKKSSPIVATEDDFIKSKKKSPHCIAKPKEYILPAASVLCNVDNLENATKTNKKLHWELLDNKNEMTEIEDDADIDSTDEEEPKIKEEPIENASTSPKQSSQQTITSGHKLQKSSPSETDTQTEDESLLKDLRRQAGTYKKLNFKSSKVRKPKQRKHKLPKTVKSRLKAIGMSNADTFIDGNLMIQKPFSIVMPKRPVGRPRKLDNCSKINTVENNIPKKKRGRKPKQIIEETQKEPLQVSFKTKTNESNEKSKETDEQQQTNNTTTAEFKCDQNRDHESLNSSDRNIPEINNMENSMKILSTSVERLEICDESCTSKDSVNERKSFGKEIEDCKYQDANNTSMIYHKHDSSTEDNALVINTSVIENHAAECNKTLENKDKAESLSEKQKFIEKHITSPNTDSRKKHQDVASSSREAQEKRDSETAKLPADKTDLHIEPSTTVSIKKHHEVPSSSKESQENRLSNKSHSGPEEIKEKSLKSKALIKPLMKRKLKSKIKNKVTNYISLEDIGIKVRPLKGHLSSFRIPKIKKDTEETLNNSWKLETYVELEKEGYKEQVKQTAEHTKESNDMKSVVNKKDCQQDKQLSSRQNVSKERETSNIKENSQQARKSSNIKALGKESNIEAAPEQLNKQQSKDETERPSNYIINIDNKTKIGKRKLYSPDMYDEGDKEEITHTENNSSQMYQEQCKYLSKTHELNPVKLRRKSVHIPKHIPDSSHNTNSDSDETRSSNKCTKPRRKSMNVHRRILDSSCDEDDDTDKQSSTEIKTNQTISKTVVDIQTKFNQQKEAKTSNMNEIKKPLRGRRKSMYVERPAVLEAVESEETASNTRRKALRRKSMYMESPALETVESEEKESNTRTKAARRQSMYVERTSLDDNADTSSKSKLLPEPQHTVDNSKSAENNNNDCDKKQLQTETIKSFKMRRKSMYTDPKSLNISKTEIAKVTDKSNNSLTQDSVQQSSKTTKNHDLELQTNKDGNQNVELSKTLGKNLNETNDKMDQTTKPIASFKMRRKSMYVERNSQKNEEVVKDKTDEIVEKKVDDSSEQNKLVSNTPIVLPQQKPIQSMRRKSTNQRSNSLNKLKDNSHQMDTDSDSEILVSQQQKPNKMRRKSTKQQPNTDISSGNISLMNNTEDKKDSVEISNSEQELKKTSENKSNQQKDSGTDSSVILTQQKSLKMRRKSTNPPQHLDSCSVDRNSLNIVDSKESKKSKQDVEKNPDSQQTAADSQSSVAVAQQKSIKIRRKSTIERRDLSSSQVETDSFIDEETKKVSVESIKTKQEVIKNPDQNIESNQKMVSKSEKSIKMRRKSTIERSNVETIDTPDSNKPKQVLQKKQQDMIPNIDNIEQKDPCSSSTDTMSQQKPLKNRRKSTNQPQITDFSSADQKQEPEKDTAADSSLTIHNSRAKEADSDASLVLTQHKSIKMRRKSTNQRRILDTSSDDDEPLIKKLTVITNEPKAPNTAVGKPRQRKRRVVKVLSTSMESPANSCQPSPFTSPTLNHPIFNTEVPTQSNEFAASMPMTPNQQDDNKFMEIDSKLHEIFQSPQYTVDYKISPAVDASNLTILPPPALNDSKSNVTIDETPDFNRENDQSSITMSQLNESSTSTLNDTTTTQNGSEIKHLSLGTADYRFEKVSDNVINLFISRKRKRKRNNLN
ncbi:serine-rich adhesin for platelets [Calliphora vicina]|uniref:serine-rich adhesin for platelets n=1 Tax=Calliphora vicina TaxID=7373 RepID=UPI00325BA4D2